MTDSPELTLAQAIRAAAEAYIEKTGQFFDGEIEFADIASFGMPQPLCKVAAVRVRTVREVAA